MVHSHHASTAQDPARRDMIAKVKHLIKDIKFAMLTTEAEDGVLHSRPMATQESEFDGTLWFFTAVSSGKVSELAWNPSVNLSYAEPSATRYVSVSGDAEVVNDRAKMEELWSEVYKVWFPKGLDDPDLCLLKLEVNTAEYWEAPSGKMIQVFGLLKALATGERPDPSGHGEIDLIHDRSASVSKNRSDG